MQEQILEKKPEIIAVDKDYKPVGTVAKCDHCGFEYLKTRSQLIKYRIKVNQKGKVVEKNYLCRNCYNKNMGA